MKLNTAFVGCVHLDRASPQDVATFFGQHNNNNNRNRDNNDNYSNSDNANSSNTKTLSTETLGGYPASERSFSVLTKEPSVNQ